MEIKISALIITKNEEKMLPDCLRSLSWVDEILVVDNDSSDATLKIAKKFGCKIINTKSSNFAQKRNIATRHAKGVWIFHIDADERVSPELKSEILSTIANPQFSGYAIPRKNFVFGQEMKHCGFVPDYVKRLFKKEDFKNWTGQLHEEPSFKGQIGHLKSKLIHVKHDTLTEMVDKTNGWSEIEAKLMLEANHPPMNIPRFLTAMLREFWLRMIRQTAFLDGPKGIIYALYQVFSRFVSYAKLWEMQMNSSKHVTS